jgi:hypothetical protein
VLLGCVFLHNIFAMTGTRRRRRRRRRRKRREDFNTS